MFGKTGPGTLDVPGTTGPSCNGPAPMPPVRGGTVCANAGATITALREGTVCANAGAVIAAANAAMVSSLSIQITPNFCVESRGAQMAPLAPLASCKERQNRYDPRFMLAALPRGSCRAGLIKPGPKPKLSEHQRQEAGAGYEPCESARTIAKSFEVECLCQPAARPLAMRDFLWNWPKRSSGWSRKVGTS